MFYHTQFLTFWEKDPQTHFFGEGEHPTPPSDQIFWEGGPHLLPWFLSGSLVFLPLVLSGGGAGTPPGGGLGPSPPGGEW